MSLHRETRFAFALFAVGLSTIIACGEESKSSTGDDDLTAQAPVTKAEAQSLFDAVDDNCAGNDNGHTSTFDPARFDPVKIMAQIREDDKDAMGVGCSDQHAYSSSREDAVKMFQDHISDRNSDAKACIEENLDARKIARLKKLVSDPANRGVFASVYSGGDNPEGCDYHHFYVYRADGMMVRFTFNYTD